VFYRHRLPGLAAGFIGESGVQCRNPSEEQRKVFIFVNLFYGCLIFILDRGRFGE
jgi:hypothetical protein